MTSIEDTRILVVDDEPDICETIVDELHGCAIDVAHDYDLARAKLKAGGYDVVILDIMGVKGHELLGEFAEVYPCIMLTAHALTTDDLKRSIRGKAHLYLPKEELGRLGEYVVKVLEEKQPAWRWLFKKLDFTKWFGKTWLIDDPEFEDLGITQADIDEDLLHGYGTGA